MIVPDINLLLYAYSAGATHHARPGAGGRGCSAATKWWASHGS